MYLRIIPRKGAEGLGGFGICAMDLESRKDPRKGAEGTAEGRGRRRGKNRGRAAKGGAEGRGRIQQIILSIRD